MIRDKIYSKVRHYFEDYLFGFDKRNFEMSLLTGNISLSDVNIRPDKLNEIFEEIKLPLALKAGLISKLHVKMSLFNYFSSAV